MTASALGLTVAMTFGYLVVVRLIDLNEKEPLWALALLFGLGALGAAALWLGFDSRLVELELVGGALAQELVRFGAVALGFWLLTLVGRSRGYSEINGLLDGVVYGATGGLGFATGLAALRGLARPSHAEGLVGQTLESQGQLALSGLADGVFGALVGVGLVLALEARSARARALGPVVGFVAACGAHVAFAWLGRAEPFAEGALAKKWLALSLPLVGVVLVVVVALGRERRAIAEELATESETGAVSAEELALLTSVWRRQRRYLDALFRGRVRRWRRLHRLHNRQVQLALAKERARGEQDEQRRAAVGAEIAALRVEVLAQKRELEAEGGVG